MEILSHLDTPDVDAQTLEDEPFGEGKARAETGDSSGDRTVGASGKRGFALAIVGTGERPGRTIKQPQWQKGKTKQPKTLSPREYRAGGWKGWDREEEGPFGRMLDFPIGPYVPNHPLLSLRSQPATLVTFPFPSGSSSGCSGPLRGTASINTGTGRGAVCTEFV